MDEDELSFLRAVPCFQGLRTEDLMEVHRCARRREPRAGEIIVCAGQRIATLYVVRRGYVCLFTTSAEGTERVLAVQGPGTTFNEAAVCDGGPALATARALTADTCIDEIPETLVSHLLTANQHLAHNIVQVLARDIRCLARLVDERSREGGVQ
jgi:CRP-like cAMP-binding protein